MQSLRQGPVEVSIIIPVYKGSGLLEKHLSPFLTWVSAQPWSTEIILVDDGSPDREITAAYAKKNQLAFIGLPANKGKGAALRTGFAAARGTIRLFTDADIPFQYDNITSVVSLLQTDPRQFIIGDRTDPSSEYFQKASRIRNWGSNLISALVNRLFLSGVTDTQCGLKGMGATIAIRLFNDTRINRFAIDIELIYLACKHSIPIRRMPVQLRFNDASSVHVAKDGLRLLLDIHRIRKIHGKRKYP